MPADDGSTPTYANNPTDPTTWSPAYAAQIQANAAQYQAAQTLIANKATLAQLEPCAELLGSSFAALLKACSDTAPTLSVQPLSTMLQNLATCGALAAGEFKRQYAAVGGTAPTT